MQRIVDSPHAQATPGPSPMDLVRAAVEKRAADRAANGSSLAEAPPPALEPEQQRWMLAETSAKLLAFAGRNRNELTEQEQLRQQLLQQQQQQQQLQLLLIVPSTPKAEPTSPVSPTSTEGQPTPASGGRRYLVAMRDGRRALEKTLAREEGQAALKEVLSRPKASAAVPVLL